MIEIGGYINEISSDSFTLMADIYLIVSLLLILMSTCLLIDLSSFSPDKKTGLYWLSFAVPGLGLLVYALLMYRRNKKIAPPADSRKF